jgi:phosphoglycerate-specific signal transduction histidine kinase
MSNTVDQAISQIHELSGSLDDAGKIELAIRCLHAADYVQQLIKSTPKDIDEDVQYSIHVGIDDVVYQLEDWLQDEFNTEYTEIA